MSREFRILTNTLVALAALAVAIWGMPRLWGMASLGSKGKEVAAKVVSQSTEDCSSRRVTHRVCEVHWLAADGHSFRLVLPEAHIPGSEVQVTYLPADPTIVVPGPKSQPPWKHLWLGLHRQDDEAVWAVLGLVVSLFVGIHLVRVFLNRKPVCSS